MSGGEAVALFNKSDWSQTILPHIQKYGRYELPVVDNQLDKIKFVLAIHLIVCKSKNNLYPYHHPWHCHWRFKRCSNISRINNGTMRYRKQFISQIHRQWVVGPPSTPDFQQQPISTVPSPIMSTTDQIVQRGLEWWYRNRVCFRQRRNWKRRRKKETIVRVLLLVGMSCCCLFIWGFEALTINSLAVFSAILFRMRPPQCKRHNASDRRSSRKYWNCEWNIG